MEVLEVRAELHVGHSYMALMTKHRQACGENLRKYGTRMDSIWALRSAYNEARNMKNIQDSICTNIERGLWEAVDSKFPDDPKWEVLVEVLRGRVKVRGADFSGSGCVVDTLDRYPTIAMKRLIWMPWSE